MEAGTDRIVGAAGDRSARGIAAAVGALIRSGELAAGTRLPTVRQLASAFLVSPTTVSEAWQLLAAAGVIRTEGRGGSFVAETRRVSRPLRFWQLAETAGRFARDLSSGVPDPALLPPVGPILAQVSSSPVVSGYQEAPVLPELESVVRRSWREICDPEALTVVDGSMDAVDRLLSSLVRIGDQVLVENPTFPPILDLIDILGATAVPVPIDGEGMVPDALRSALDDSPRGQPRVLMLQPRAQNPTGVSMTRTRASQLAETLCAAPGCWIIEDDHAADIVRAEPVSLAAWLPDRTVHIRSFSKSHGPDLRLAAAGGPVELIDELVARRGLGPAWSSRLLQGVLVAMLEDEASIAAVAHAREIYAERRTALVRALSSHGLHVLGDDGFNVWLDVADERDALVVLASQGIGAAPGSPFTVGSPGGAHLRVTTAVLPVEDAGPVAETLARAAMGHRGVLGAR